MERERVIKTIADLGWKAHSAAALQHSYVVIPVVACEGLAVDACYEVREAGASVN